MSEEFNFYSMSFKYLLQVWWPIIPCSNSSMLNPISSTLLVLRSYIHVQSWFYNVAAETTHPFISNISNSLKPDHIFPQSSKEKSTKIIRNILVQSHVQTGCFWTNSRYCTFYAPRETLLLLVLPWEFSCQPSIFPFAFFKAKHVFFLGVRHVAAVL